MIDPHADVLVEGSGAVILPGVATGLGAMQAIGVHQTPAAKPEEGIPLLRGNVGPAVAGLRVPHVLVLGGDIEVTPEHQGLRGIAQGVESVGEMSVPGQLGLVEG